MGHTVIRLSRCCALVLVAFAFVVGCGSPSHVQSSHQSAAPTPTAQPSPSTGESQCPNSDGKAPALVTLQEYSFHPGHDVVFNGTGFQPGEGVDVRLGDLKSNPSSQNDQALTTVYSNTAGNMTGTAHVGMMSPGTYHLYFIGEQCTPAITINIILLPFTPWVTLDNYAPHPHYLLGFRGQDFTPGETVQVYLNDQNSQPVAQVQADTSGQFAVNQAWDVGDLTGDNTLIFVGSASKMAVSVHFTVLSQQPALAAAFLGQSVNPTGPLTAAGHAATGSSVPGPVSAPAADKRASISSFSATGFPLVFC